MPIYKVLSVILLWISLSSAHAAQPKLLVVLSEADSITLKGGKKHSTGYYLSELIVPVSAVQKLGYQIDVATPNGKKPTLDRSSDSAQFFKSEQEYKELKAQHKTLLQSKMTSLAKLNEKQLSQYDGVFFPGGHAPLTDLSKSESVNRALRYFHRAAKPTALICHGPAALLAAKTKEEWPYRDYQMTGFSTAEEKQAEAGALGGEVEYYLDRALKEAGGKVQVAESWKPHSIRDIELITAQNPQSDHLMTEQLLVALAEIRLKETTNSVPYEADTKNFSAKNVYEVTPFPNDWQQGFTNVYIGARKKGVKKADFMKLLGKHLPNAKKVFGPVGMRGYLVLSNGDYEISFMNWPSKQVAQKAGSAEGREVVLEESASILESFGVFEVPEPSKLPISAKR